MYTEGEHIMANILLVKEDVMRLIIARERERERKRVRKRERLMKV